ncbi:MAG: VOC family protein [Verrucomicrobiota bacterium]
MSDITPQRSQEQKDQTFETIPGTFAWNELLTSHPEESKNFYTQLFNWTAQAIPGLDEYQMFNAGNHPVAGFEDKSAHGDGPPVWLAYVNVADVTASVAKAKQLGAEIVKEVTKVPDKGTYAVIKDPQGAKLGLWQSV